jgi:NitT/TauT family transport system ATP-binding protein
MSVRVSLHDVSQQFGGHGRESLPVLEHIDLEVEPGELVALLGPSGCGKSTLLRIIAGLDPPSGGEALIDGAPITGTDPHRALVFQDPTLFPWRDVWHNVAIGPQARHRLDKDRDVVNEVIDMVGLSGFAHVRPNALSGGMAQRVSLARALVNQPSLLLLDEPLGKLDALTRLTLQQEILRLWRQAGFTALLVTHDVDEGLLMADRVVVLSDRPARILADLKIDVERPRSHGDPRLEDDRRKVLGLLGFTDAETAHAQ